MSYLVLKADYTGCRGSELLREVVWVIFDEVHYMQVISCSVLCQHPAAAFFLRS